MIPRRGTRHLSAETAIDFLDQRLRGRRLQEVERHLGMPCAKCRSLIHTLGATIEKLRSAPLETPPAWLEKRALDVFEPRPEASPVREAVSRLMELVFDSRTAPLLAHARRAVGEARRLRFSAEGCTIEIESDIESPESTGLRGRLTVDQPALHRIEVRAGEESRSAWPDSSGSFAISGLPRLRMRIVVTGPAGRFRLPPFTP